MATTSGTQITLSPAEANYTLTGVQAMDIFGNDLNNKIYGNSAANLISGGAGNDSLTGGGGDDSLYGGLGGDTLDGGMGNDLLVGGDGDDSYVIDSAGDIVQEVANQGARDVVYTYTVNNYVLPSYVEYLTLQGTAHLNGYGNELANRMIGNSGDNLLDAGAGNDEIYAGAGNDTLYGGEGNDILNGQDGRDELYGGVGNDNYYITAGEDSIFENANEGIDTVAVLGDFTLGANFENLTLTGTANTIGYGNALNNILLGNAGNNQLFGGAGNDTLDSRGGTDTLVGGTGNDLYVVHSLDDVVVENPGEGVDTLNLAFVYGYPGEYHLADGVENMRVVVDNAGYVFGNDLDNSITANTPSIHGLGGNDTIVSIPIWTTSMFLYGDDGDDSISSLGTEFLYNIGGLLDGGAGDDVLKLVYTSGSVLTGGAGNDVLEIQHSRGGSHLIGGEGDDTYLIDADSFVQGTSAIYIVERENEGVDLIKAGLSFSLTYDDQTNADIAGYVYSPSYDLGSTVDNIENLTLTGGGNIHGYGNSIKNVLTGNTGDNLLDGRAGNDTLIGMGGNDVLQGGDGDDILQVNLNQRAGVNLNQAGATNMTGGLGSDVFWMVRGYVGDHASGANQLAITDFTHGEDIIRFTFTSSQATPGTLNTLTASAGEVLSSLLNRAAAGGSASAPVLTSFVFNGDTYLVCDQSSNTSFNAKTDLAIKIAGAPSLTFSDLDIQLIA